MRVVIADDSVLIREGVALLLAEHGVDVVAQVADPQALMARVREHRPDVAVIDIRMPPTHTDEGLLAAARIRAEHSETATLVLSQHLEPDYAVRLIEESPAKIGYLLKERLGRVEHLLDALRRVADGECVIDQEIVAELMNQVRGPGPLDQLTRRERDILALIAEGRSNQGICSALWLSPKTVEAHIHNIFAKLDIPAAPHDNRRVLAVLTLLRA
jgi:serine/threonine-protein kinase